jgi:tetratricopeptide (TPR) repeat protein
LLAFSMNNPRLLHHAVGDSRDVLDYDSDLAVMDFDEWDLRVGERERVGEQERVAGAERSGAPASRRWGTAALSPSHPPLRPDSHSPLSPDSHPLPSPPRISRVPQIADPDFWETFPAWSPDGEYLYFSRAPRLWRAETKEKSLLPPGFRRVRYDLYRVSYHGPTGLWGKLEKVLAAADTGLSITEPRVSPDGRLLLFCMHDYGSFPVYQQSSDLYLMDVKTRRYWRPDINSERSESWHSWSGNSRWIVFASKRRDGLFGRLYFSYIDSRGEARKPFLLPQDDPAFYDSFLENFNAPEFVEGPVKVPQEKLDEAARSPEAQQAIGDGPRAAPFDPLVLGHPVEREALAALVRAAQGPTAQAADHLRLAKEWEAWSRPDRAVACYRKAIEVAAESDPCKTQALARLAWILATHPTDAVRDGSNALQFARQVCQRTGETAESLDLLAAACAEAFLLQAAVQEARRAEALAQRANNAAQLRRIRMHLDFYLAGQPFRDTVP